MCLTASFLATGGQLVFWLPVVVSNYFTKFHDFSMIVQGFSNSMIFPCMEHFCEIFQVFHDFKSLWEPCSGDLDQMPHSAASNLGLRCLPVPQKDR